jgi:hypothetical protein
MVRVARADTGLRPQIKTALAAAPLDRDLKAGFFRSQFWLLIGVDANRR